MAILSAVGLTIGYSDRVLLRNFYFDVYNPCIIAIVGNNGCGKSTFLKSLAGIQKYSGTLKIFDKDVNDYAFENLTKHLSLLGQQNPVNFSIPVKEIVVMGRFSKKKLFENYSSEDYTKAEEVMEVLEIGHLKERDFVTLSGGEQQLVWISQLLLQDTQIMLFDEPMQYLDLYYKNKLVQLFSKEVSEKGKTIIFSTHDLDLLKELQGYIADLSAPQPQLEEVTFERVNSVIKSLKTRHTV